MCQCNCQCECHQTKPSLNPVVGVGLALFSGYLLLKAFSEWLQVDFETGTGVLFGSVLALGTLICSLMQDRHDWFHISRTWAVILVLAVMSWLPVVPFWAQQELLANPLKVQSTLQTLAAHPVALKMATLIAFGISLMVWLRPRQFRGYY